MLLLGRPRSLQMDNNHQKLVGVSQQRLEWTWRGVQSTLVALPWPLRGISSSLQGVWQVCSPNNRLSSVHIPNVDKALFFSFCNNFLPACVRPSLLPPHDILASTNPPLVVDSPVPVSRVYDDAALLPKEAALVRSLFRGAAPAEPRPPGARPAHRGLGAEAGTGG